eukprot:Pgem_evm1s11935
MFELIYSSKHKAKLQLFAHYLTTQLHISLRYTKFISCNWGYRMWEKTNIKIG